MEKYKKAIEDDLEPSEEDIKNQLMLSTKVQVEYFEPSEEDIKNQMMLPTKVQVEYFEPSEEDIKNQVMLPTKLQVETQSFKDPITNWVSVEPSQNVPSWSKAVLPEEEIVKGPDWKPPTPPRVDISLIYFTQQFESETHTPTATSSTLPDKKMVLRANFAENEEICYYENGCVVRTTMGALQKAERNGGGGFERRWDGDKGDRGFRGGSRRDDNWVRNRFMSSSSDRNSGDFRSREQKDQRHQRRDRSRSPLRERRNDRNSRESRDHRREGDRDREFRRDRRDGRNRYSVEGRNSQGDRSRFRELPTAYNNHPTANRNPLRASPPPPAQVPFEGRNSQGDRSRFRELPTAYNNHPTANRNRNPLRTSPPPPAQVPFDDGVPKTYKEYKEWKGRQALLVLK